MFIHPHSTFMFNQHRYFFFCMSHKKRSAPEKAPRSQPFGGSNPFSSAEERRMPGAQQPQMPPQGSQFGAGLNPFHSADEKQTQHQSIQYVDLVGAVKEANLTASSPLIQGVIF